MAWKELTREDVIANVEKAIKEGMIESVIDLEAGLIRIRARVNGQMYRGAGKTQADAVADVVSQVMSGMRK